MYLDGPGDSEVLDHMIFCNLYRAFSSRIFPNYKSCQLEKDAEGGNRASAQSSMLLINTLGATTNAASN
jgi:hypothetical protein